MGEQACQISNYHTQSKTRLANRFYNRRLSFAGLGTRHAEVQEPVHFGRCQMSVEENIAKIQNAYRRFHSSKDLVMVVFTVSQSNVLVTLSKTNCSGVSLRQYLYDAHYDLNLVMAQILSEIERNSECYCFIPGKKSRRQFLDNALCQQISRARMFSYFEGGKVIYLDMVSECAREFSSRQIGADARHWLDVSMIGVSGIMAQYCPHHIFHDELLSAVLYADLALLHKLLVTPVSAL